MLFGWDRSTEAGFYDAALRHHGVPDGARVLEVACGTGQIALRLAARGWRVTGLDHSTAMLAFLAERAAQDGVSVVGLERDMRSFVLLERQAAAYNPLSSFRLLLADGDARAHLECVAEALEPGGIYVLDITFGTSGDAEDDLEWSMERDGVVVRSTPECVEVRDPARGTLALDWHEQLRPYSPTALRDLVTSTGRFAVETCHRESGRGEDDVSLFDLTSAALPEAGRAMVVLRRDA